MARIRRCTKRPVPKRGNAASCSSKRLSAGLSPEQAPHDWKSMRRSVQRLNSSIAACRRRMVSAVRSGLNMVQAKALRPTVVALRLR